MAVAIKEIAKKYEVNTVVDLIQIITKMLDANGIIGLSQLSDSLSISKNKAFRLLTTLSQFGLVEKDNQNKYRIGIEFVGIAQRIIATSSRFEIVRSYMEELVSAINEAVYFARYTGTEAVLVDFVDCSHPIKAASFVGKAIQFPVNANLVTREMGRIGEVAIDVGGLNSEITTVSMHYAGTGGGGMGALVVLAPTFRMNQDRIRTEIVPALRAVLHRKEDQFSAIAHDRLLPVFPPVEHDYGRYPHVASVRGINADRPLWSVHNC